MTPDRPPGDRPADVEFDAYIDGQLDLERQLAVEAWLSERPAEAARHMADLRSRSALKLLMCAEAPPTRRQAEAFARLARMQDRGRRMRGGLGAGLGLAAALAMGVFVARPSPPAYVEEAAAAHSIALLRARMPSQIETPAFDAADLKQGVQMTVPTLPDQWRITDVQVFPSSEGPALLIAVTTDRGEQLSLFTVRRSSKAPEIPDAVRAGSHAVAYWRRGGASYALTGDTSVAEIDRTAEALAVAWRS